MTGSFHRITICIIAIVVLLGVSLTAHAATISVVDRGWFRSDGLRTAGNENAFFGRWSGRNYNAYLVFDVSGLSGQTSSISMNLELEGYFSGNGSETFEIFDVSTSELLLASGYASGSAAGQAIFNDLGTGSSYATLNVLSSEVGSVLNLTLSSQATTDLDAAVASDGLFALGFVVTSAVGNQGLRWGTNADWDAGTIITTEIVTTPEPATAVLIGMSLMALCWLSSSGLLVPATDRLGIQ